MNIRPLALPGIEALSGLPQFTNQELYNNLPTREEAKENLKTVLSYAGAKVLITVRTAAGFLGSNKPRFKDAPAFPPLSERKAFVTEGFTSSYATEGQLDSLLQERDDVADKLQGALAIIESYKSAYDSISGALEGIAESVGKDYSVFYQKGEEMEQLHQLKERLTKQLQALNLAQYRPGQSYAEFFQQVADDLEEAKQRIKSYEEKISKKDSCFVKMSELLNENKKELKKLTDKNKQITDENKQINEEAAVCLAQKNSIQDASNKQSADLESTKKELESTRQQMNLLEKNLAGSAEKISEFENMRSKYSIMCKRMTAIEQKEEKLKSDLLNKDEEIQNFKTSLEQQKQNNNALSSFLENAKSSLEEVNLEVNRLHSEKSDLFNEIDGLKQKITESEQTEKNAANLKKKLSAAKTEITAKTQKIQELEEKIDELELEKDKLNVMLMEPRDNHTAPDVSHFYSMEPGRPACFGESSDSSLALRESELSSMGSENTMSSSDTGMISSNIDSGPHSILPNVEEPESNKTSNFENKLLLKRVREAEDKLQQSENKLESTKEEFAQFKNENRGRLRELNSEKQLMQTKLKAYESEQGTLQVDLEKANQEIRELEQKLTDQHSEMQTELSKAEVAYEAENKELLDLKLKFKHDEQVRFDLQETQNQLATETDARGKFVADLYKQLGEEHKAVIEALVEQHFGV